MEDSRFKEIKTLKKRDVPHKLHWFISEDYFSEELIGIYSSEVSTFYHIAKETYELFEKATQKIIADQRLDYLGIPSFFHKAIENSWNNRKDNPFFCGRFDINGGFDYKEAKVIEFNADTFSTLPETIEWQKLQLKELTGMKSQFNTLEDDLLSQMMDMKSKIQFDDACFMASSFGHQEDIANCDVILDIAHKAGFNSYYADLKDVTFSEDDGILYQIGNEYQPVDVWFKVIPWDWMFTEEPNLAQSLAVILEKKLALVLNPPYTAVWQNKKFLAYITEHFRNQYVAETYLQPQNGDYVEKPVYGRMGENIKVMTKEAASSKGDFSNQEKIYQKYYPLVTDRENYFYQLGMFYTNKPSAINFRTQPTKIITDDCEFMSHYII